jgi:hypothetical protein
MTTPLPAIFALARAGASRQAWRLFVAAGHDRSSDPDALTLHGRLLKDQALAASGADRAALAAQAGAAYAAAAAARPATYPLINAATLALLAGDPAAAAARAAEVLHLLETTPEPDTPWWQGATRAEALLLMGDTAGAASALSDAIAVAPLAWEDHAVTLRQFAVVIAHQGGDAGWLDAHRPPRSLHFAGSLHLDAPESELATRIDAIIAAERIGFGYGALAAGADLLIAERLLAAGAELHVLLPGGEDAFVRESVAPWGQDARFAAVLERAASVRAVGDAALPDLAMAEADQLAMGLAVMNAGALASQPVQLVIGGAGPGQHSARLAANWATSGRRQHVLGSLPAAQAQPASPAQLAAIIAVRPLGQPASLATTLALADRLPPLPDATIAGAGDALLLILPDPAAAASAAMALRSRLARTGPVSLASHYGAVIMVAGQPMGPAITTALAIAAATPDTAFYASEAFAAALNAGALPAGIGCAPVGDLARPGADPVPLLAVD